MSINRTQIVIRPDTKGEKSEQWDLATPENFERVIWDSISTYNYRAQLDIARLLLRTYQGIPSNSINLFLAHNLALRIFQLYYETADQFALVCRSIINRPAKDVFESYIEGDNLQTRTFFKQCAKDQLSEVDIKRIWGLDFLERTNISDQKDRQKIREIADSVVVTEKKNLKKFGDTYVTFDDVTGRVNYAGAVKGSFAVKHGFKYLYPSKLAMKMWKLSSAAPTIMQEIVEITRQDTGEKRRTMKIGSLVENAADLSTKLDKLIRQIGFLSREIQVIAMIQLGVMDDPFYLIGRFHKDGIVKFTRNEKCPCGSGLKFKKCHYLRA